MEQQSPNPAPSNNNRLLQYLRDPAWQAAGVIATLLIGVIGFYYSQQQEIWLYVAAAIVVIIALIAGFDRAAKQQIAWYLVAVGFMLIAAVFSGIISGRHLFTQPLTPTATNVNAVSLKSMPSLYIAPFGDSDDTVRQELSYRLAVIHNPDGGVNYKFEYNLPSSGFGYAGFQFVFDHPQILEDYKFIEIDMAFGDATTGCSLKLRDNNGQDKSTRILGPNLPFRIPIEMATEGLNLEGIKSIEFIALTDFSRGYHTFTVSDVRLVK